eukprot:scaffold13716_cov33-Prasinocladus_malaysianus.AAC.1
MSRASSASARTSTGGTICACFTVSRPHVPSPAPALVAAVVSTRQCAAALSVSAKSVSRHTVRAHLSARQIYRWDEFSCECMVVIAGLFVSPLQSLRIYTTAPRR